MGVVLGTAGHIDHGKTALIKALTGVDTDRLREEKERGISIDLGFTHLDLPGPAGGVGVVDVPGHERFVKNMLAGACGIDMVLLVVASDEGVMPQTREHVDICALLGIEKAVVAMTKIDMADPELAEAAVADVEQFLSGTPYEGSRIVRVSSATGEGLDELRAALASAAGEIAHRASGGAFRMPIDRSFVMEGFGTVVTGTTWSGAARVGDPLEVLPSVVMTRVRAVQVHGAVVESVGPGVRAALALHGVRKSDIGRGDWAVAPGRFTPSHMLDVTLSLIEGTGKPLTTRSRVRFHLGSSEILGRVVLLEGDELRPGECALAQFRLEGPAVAAKGDRFVIRTYSPARTIGGGTVLVPVASKHRRRDRAAIESLARQAAGDPKEDLREVVSRSDMKGVSLGATARRMGLEIKALERMAAEQVRSGSLVSVGGDKYVTAKAFEKASGMLADWIKHEQSRHPLRWGVPKGGLKSKAKTAGMGSELFESALDELRSSGRLYFREDRLRVDSAAPELDAVTERRLDEIEETYRAAGYSPPTLKELAARGDGSGGACLGSGNSGRRANAAGGPGGSRRGGREGWDVRDFSEALEFLAMEGRLEKISSEMFFHAKAMADVKRKLARYFDEHGTLSVPDFKGLVGVSRKFAVPLLEHLDRDGVTRRVGDRRAPGRLLRKSPAREDGASGAGD